MLNKSDTALVRAYFYDSFPELKGRVAVRSFTPNVVWKRGKSRDEEVERRSAIGAEMQSFKEDLADQLAPDISKSAFSVINALPYPDKEQFEWWALWETPSLLSLSLFDEKRTLKQDIFYIHQWAPTWDDLKIYN